MTPTEPRAYDAFVSYSSSDQAWVHGTLLSAMDAAGVRVCVDTRDFVIGMPAAENIERAVATSRHLVPVLSPHWLSSGWTRFEQLLAQQTDPVNSDGRVLPLLLEDCALPPRLRILTYLDLRAPALRARQLERLIARLREAATPAEKAPGARSAPTIGSSGFSWRRGLERAGTQLAGSPDEVRVTLATLESRLLDNLDDERRFGTHEGIRSDRSRIVDELNRLLLGQLRSTFTDLCRD